MTTAPEVTTADLSEESSTTALLRAAIGPVNTGFYLPVFTRFETLERAGTSWNWAASLCTLNWLAYRQLWSAALAYAGVMVGAILMVFGIGRLVFQFSEGVELGLLLGLALAAFAVPGIYGNALLYRACRVKMSHALYINPTVPEACTMLTTHAPSRLRLLLLALANVSILGAAVAGYVEMPTSGALPYSVLKTTDHASQAAPMPIPVVVAAAAPTPPSTPAPEPIQLALAPNPVVAAPVSEPVPEPVPVAVTATPAIAPAAAAVVPTAAPVAAVPAKVEKKSNKKPTKKADSSPAPKKAASAPAAKAASAARAARAKAAKAPPETHFYANVGLYADSNNALHTYTQLKDAGLAAWKQEFNTSKGKRTRVRVGPFESENEARSAVEKVRALGLEAIILRPEKSAEPAPAGVTSPAAAPSP